MDVRSARTAVDRIRKVVAAGTAQWTDTELLATLDEVLSSIWTQTNMAGRDHNVDAVDLLTTDATSPTPDLVRVTGIASCYDFEPPGYMGPIRTLEWIAQSGASEAVVPIPSGPLRMAKDYLGAFPQELGWYRYWQDRIRIHGLSSNPKVRVTFLRRWPPMHFGQTTVAGTISQMTLAVTAGRAPARHGWYNGSRIEWNSGANLDAVVRVNSNTAPLILNFLPAVTFPVSSGEQYSLLLPCDPEHADYAIQETALRLLSGRDANAAQANEQRAIVAKLEQAFLADLSERDMARQRRPTNSRVYR